MGSREQNTVRGIEENTIEFLLALGRAAESEEHRDDSVHWTIGGSPIDYHNCVVRADLSPENVDRVIDASIACLRKHGVPGTWHVGPSMRPSDLGERLLARGFRHGGQEPGMAIDLRGLHPADPPDAFAVQRVGDAEGLAAWADVLGQGFGEGPPEARWVHAMYQRIGLDDPRWRHYLGYDRAEPVATASSFDAAGVAGVYFVSTLPRFRGRGFGSAITRAALLDARSLGQPTGVLGSSEAGFSVYSKLGFRQYCAFELYEFSVS